ncbi:MAG: AMP-binding protein [Bacillota bacterium]|nr:AMP-binding protein [Bacillota bacterium]
MKLSFSTRGWDHLTWDEWVDAALQMRFQGLEIYSLHKNPSLYELTGPFHQSNRMVIKRSLFDHKLSISCFDSYCDLSRESPQTLDQVRFLMDTAQAMEVPYVAVAALDENPDQVHRNLEALLPHAADRGIILLIKTCGIYGDTARLRDLLNTFACDELAVLWDMHHPYRSFHEDPAETIKNLGAYVRHVHLRDSDDVDTYNLIGEGTLPVAEMINALYSINYGGFISLEWKPAWMEDLQDHEIILPHFVNYMKRFQSPKSRKKELYYNFDHTGQYIWEPDILIDETFSLMLDRVVEEFPDQYAFKYTTLDYTRTYSEFRDDVDTFARALLSMGVRPGSKVAIWATNLPEWFITFWATVKIGAVLVTVNTAYKIHEIEYLLRQSDTHTLVTIESALDSNYAKAIQELCPELENTVAGESLHAKRLPFLRNVITVGFRMKGCLTFAEAMGRADQIPLKDVHRLAAAVKVDDVCNMQYTSGTTGFPKGVMLTHYNIVNNGKAIGDRMGLSTADRMLIHVPMFHCFGMVLTMTASMTHGATMCPLPYFSAKASLACINLERITAMNGVPTMFIAMFNHPDFARTDFSYMRTGIMAGSGCPAELMRRAAQPHPEGMSMRGIVSVYGQTETAPGNTMSAWQDPLDMRAQTVGYPFPHIQCKIVDPDTGKELGPGADGEFCARGYNVMKGYYKMPNETREAIDQDGWLHSGDLAQRTPEGYYIITGRLKDMIIRGGENIYPKEIEEFIYTHDKVQDVQVIGIPSERYGEEVMACVILKDGESMTEREMKDYIASRLSRHKVPRHVVFVDSFPMNAAGKIMKYKMRENAEEYLKAGKGEPHD